MRVLIIDDEPLARARLIRMIARIPDTEVVGEAQTVGVALVQLALQLPDVLLLDLQLPGVTGLELAARPGLPPIIFTTAHVQLATLPLQWGIALLLKPIRQERLIWALAQVQRTSR